MAMIITDQRKIDLAKLAAGEIPVGDTFIDDIALGDGGLVDGVPRVPLSSETALGNETLRRAAVLISRVVDINTWEIVLITGELSGFQFNEVAAFSANGNMIGIETFPTKTKIIDQAFNIKVRENFNGL